MKKTFFYVGYCAFVMPMILFFSAHGASSVRSLGDAVQSSVAKANANTTRVSSLPLTSKNNIVANTNVTTDVKNNTNTAAESQQRMPFGVHISSTNIPTSTSGDIAFAQQRGELIARTGELEDRTTDLEDRAVELKEHADATDFEISKLKEKDEEHDSSIADLSDALATKLKNTATGENSLAISDGEGEAYAGGNESVAIGNYASIDANTSRSIAIVSEGGVEGNSDGAIAIGANAWVLSNAAGAIQLGEGGNNKSNTLQFRDWRLVDSDGKIPADRLTNAPKTTYTSGDGIDISDNVISLKADALSEYATKDDLIGTPDLSEYMKIGDMVKNTQLASGGKSGQVLQINDSDKMTWANIDGAPTYSAGNGISINADDNNKISINVGDCDSDLCIITKEGNVVSMRAADEWKGEEVVPESSEQ